MSEIIPTLAEEIKNTKGIVSILSGDEKKENIKGSPYKKGVSRAKKALDMLEKINPKYLNEVEVTALQESKIFYQKLIDENEAEKEKQIKEREKAQEKQHKLDTIEKNFKTELRRVTDEKLKIFSSGNIADAQNAIASLVAQKKDLTENILVNNSAILKKYTENINIHIQDYLLFLLSTNQIEKNGNITKKDITSYITNNLAITDNDINFDDLLATLNPETSETGGRFLYTNIKDLRTAVENKTLFTVKNRISKKTGKVLFSYSPLVTINIKSGEEIPQLLATKIEKLRLKTSNTKGEPVFAKIHEIKRSIKKSKEKIQINKKLIEEGLTSYYENRGNIALLKTGRLQIDLDSTNDEYRQNTVNGKVGKHFSKMGKGVHCAAYVAMYLNLKLNLPKGRIIAGDAWIMIENLKAGNLMKEITAKNNKYSIQKAHYTNSYTNSLSEHYAKIQKAFETSNMPMVLGVHFLNTATDQPRRGGRRSSTGRGALLRAQRLYENGSPKVKYKPTANSHVFALENNFSRNIEGRNRNLKTIFKILWNGNRHINSEGKGATLDLNSPLINDLDVEYTNENKKIVTVKAEKLLKNGKQISGKIVVKGLGMSDEIGGSVKKAFFAFRMSTYSQGRAMYTFVQAGQISEPNLIKDEKAYNTIMKGIDISYKNITLNSSDKNFDKELYAEVKSKYKKYRGVNVNTNEIDGAYLEERMQKIINENITPSIEKYSPLYFKTRALYAQFFRIASVQSDMKTPVFNSREDLETAIKKYDTELTKKFKHIKTHSGFVQIGESSSENSIKSTKDLIKAFLKKAKEQNIDITNIDITKPAIQKEFHMFLQSIGNFNKNSYFDAIMDESVKYSDMAQNKIFSQFFLHSSKIYFTKEHLQDLANNLRKTEYSVKKQELSDIESVFNEIPWDILKNKLGYPLSEKEMYDITNGDAEKMRALILIWIRETAWGKEYLLKSRGKESGIWSDFTTWAMNSLDSAHANIFNSASAGDWQVKIPKLKNPEKNAELILHKTNVLINKIKDLNIQNKDLKEDLESLKKYFLITKNEKNVRKLQSFVEKLKTKLVQFYEKYPQAGAIMAVSHIEDIYSSISTQLKNAKTKGENITKKTTYDYIVNSWSSPVANAQSIIVNTLDNIINKYGLKDVYKKIDEKTNKLQEKKDGWVPNFLPNKIRSIAGEIVSPSEKGKIRTIEMTKAILKFLRSDKEDTKSINSEILKRIKDDIKGETDKEKLENFFKKVETELNASENNPKSKALFLATKSLEPGSDIKTSNTEHFKVLFSALRSATPNITTQLDTDKIVNNERKQMGNYIGAGTEGLNSLLTPLTKNEKKAEEKRVQQNITTQKIIKDVLSLTKDNNNLKENTKLAIKIQKILFNLGLFFSKSEEKSVDGDFGPASRKAMSAIDEKLFKNKVKSEYSKSDIQKLLTVYKTAFVIQKKQSNNSTEMSLFLKEQKSTLRNKNEFVSAQKTIKSLENILEKYSEKTPDFTLNLKERKTAKVIQQLISEFGLYDGEFDGIFGRASQKALQSIGAIGYTGGKELTLSDITALINFYKENIRRNKTFGSNSVETALQIDSVENIKQELNDNFLKKYSNKRVVFNKLVLLHSKIIGLENSNVINRDKVQNLKNRILQIQLKLLGYYNGRIDGDIGINSQKAFQKLLSENKELSEKIKTKGNYIHLISQFLNKNIFEWEKQEKEALAYTFSGVLQNQNISQFNKFENKNYGSGGENINCMSTMDRWGDQYYQKYVKTKPGDNARFSTYFKNFAPKSSRNAIDPKEYKFEKNKIYLVATGDGHHSGFLTVNSSGEKIFSHAGINFIKAKNGKVYDYSQSDQYKQAVISGNLSKLRNITNIKRVSGKNGLKYFKAVDKNKPINLTFNGVPVEIDPKQKQGGFYSVKWEDYCKSNPKDTKSVWVQELSTKII